MATQIAKDFFLGWFVKDTLVEIIYFLLQLLWWTFSFPNSRILHPLVFGDYPDTMKRLVGKRLPSFSEEETKVVKDSSDFIGVIHYTTMTAAHVSTFQQGDFSADMNALVSRMLFLPMFCPSTMHEFHSWFFFFFSWTAFGNSTLVKVCFQS